MSRKSKHNKNDFIMSFEPVEANSNEDLLAEKNRSLLSAFGKSIDEKSGNLNLPVTENQKKPLASLKAKMGIRDMSDTPKEEALKTPAAEEHAEPDKTVHTPDKSERPETAVQKKEEKEISLLEKLKRYTIDESGHDVTEDEAPLYTLKSVAEIIKSDSNALINKLSEKYNVTIDTLGRPGADDFLLNGVEADFKDVEESKDTTEPESENQSKPVPTPAFEKMATESRQRFEKSIFDDILSEETKPATPVESTADISDIDDSAPDKGLQSDEDRISNTATIRFTPIKDEKGNTGRINISSLTRVVDISQELMNANETEEPDPEPMFEASDFDLFAPKNEITDIAEAKSAIRKLSYKRRNNFLAMTICAICTFVIALFLTPALSDKVISSTKSVITLCSGLMFVTILANIDMFADIINLFRHRASHDCIVALFAVFSIPLCIQAMIIGENIFNLILLSAFIMLIRSIMNFINTSTMLSGIKAIRSPREKFAVSFIKDSSTALAMAKNAIEGDVLIAAPRKAEFINDFVKYSSYKKKFSGKIPVIFVITLVLSVLGAAMGYFYYKTAFAALYAAYAAGAMAAMPTLMFVDILPCFSAAKKLRKKGAMIAGTFGADSIELSNAAVVHTSDIFPAGSITLKSFKVLSNNSVDETIINAAALTEEIGSPLAPIFNKIAGTNTSYKKPDSDTIKYEEKLGISGWVNDELLFIGNRTLMEAHGIEVPSIEVDKKILRSGYFPVYVATAGKPSALVVIQYEVRSDIQKLLRQITGLGVTLLVKNCDPNVSEEMICDYFGLYEDSVKVMTNVGVHMMENATADTGAISAPASFMGSKLTLLRIMNCASRIRISNNILSVFYVLSSVLGIWYFAFTSFTQSGGLLSGGAILLFELLATAFSLLAFLFRKP